MRLFPVFPVYMLLAGELLSYLWAVLSHPLLCFVPEREGETGGGGGGAVRGGRDGRSGEEVEGGGGELQE